MGLLSWTRRQVGRVLPAANADREKAYLGEMIKAYQIAYNRLSPFTDNLTGETPEIREQYRQMLKEPTAKAAFLTKVFAVASLELTIKPTCKDQPAKDLADFHRDNLMKSKGGVRNIVESMLFGALLDGFSVCEKVKHVAERGKWRGKVVLQQLKPKDVSNGKIQVIVDQFKNVIGLRANVNNQGREFQPGEFVIFTYLGLFGSPLGMSDMRAVYRASTLKEATIKLRMIYLDKFTGPYLKGKYSDDSIRVYLETALKKARQSGYINLPMGSDVEVVNLAQRGTADFKSAIDDFDREILVGLQGASLHMLEGKTPGGRGDTTFHQGTADLFNWYLASLVTDALNDQVIPEFTDLNFTGKPELPAASLGGVDPDAVLAELSIDEKLHGMGVPLSLEDLYERANRSAPKTPEDGLPGAPPKSGNTPGTAPGDLATPNGQQAPAVASSDLRATVGGSQAVAELQRAYYAGELPREAAMANAQLLFGFTQQEAERLLPVQNPVKLTPAGTPAPAAAPAKFDDAAATVEGGGSRAGTPFDLAAQPDAD